MPTPPEERERLIRSARSLCWEAFGDKTEDMSDAQCLIRAAVLVEVTLGIEAATYLDLAEELTGEQA